MSKINYYSGYNETRYLYSNCTKCNNGLSHEFTISFIKEIITDGNDYKFINKCRKCNHLNNCYVEKEILQKILDK